MGIRSSKLKISWVKIAENPTGVGCALCRVTATRERTLNVHFHLPWEKKTLVREEKEKAGNTTTFKPINSRKEANHY